MWQVDEMCGPELDSGQGKKKKAFKNSVRLILVYPFY